MREIYTFYAIAWCTGFVSQCDASIAAAPEIVIPRDGLGFPSDFSTHLSHVSLNKTLMIEPDEGCGLFGRIVEAADRAGRGVVEAARRRRRYQTQLLKEIEEANHDIALEPESIKFSSRCRGLVMSCLAGLSTAVGAAVVFFLPGGRASEAQMAFVLALAGGVMLSITVFEFWLPALTSSESSIIHVAICSAIGAACFLLMSRLMPEPQFASVDVEAPSDMYRDPAKGGVKSSSSRSSHLAAVLLISLSVHNFPEGFAVAASSLSSQSSGFAVMLAIALHNIPEGIAIAVPVLEASGSRAKALWMTLLSGLAEPFGALLALLLVDTVGVESQQGIESLLCMVGGVMLAVAAKELLPEGWSQGQPVAFACGLSLGVALMLGTICLGA